MKHKITDVDNDAEKLIPPNKPDGSGIVVNYADAYIKPMNTTLEDGTKVAIKRRGLKLTLAIGDKKGEGLMRLLDNGPDVKNILQEALKAAAGEAGATFSEEDGGIYLDIN